MKIIKLRANLLDWLGIRRKTPSNWRGTQGKENIECATYRSELGPAWSRSGSGGAKGPVGHRGAPEGRLPSLADLLSTESRAARNERPSRVAIAAAAEEEAGAPHKRHPHLLADERDYHVNWPLPFLCNQFRHSLLSHPSFSACHAINRVAQWCEVFSQLVATLQILALLLLLHV